MIVQPSEYSERQIRDEAIGAAEAFGLAAVLLLLCGLGVAAGLALGLGSLAARGAVAAHRRADALRPRAFAAELARQILRGVHYVVIANKFIDSQALPAPQSGGRAKGRS